VEIPEYPDGHLTVPGAHRKPAGSVGSADPVDALAIDEYVASADDASLYHLHRWHSIIEDCFGHKCRYLLCRGEGGAIRGILPLTHMKSMMFGNFLVSMPYFNYGGVCAGDEPSRRLLVAEAVRIAESVGASHIELRQERPLDGGLPAKTNKVSMRLRLPGSRNELWRSLPSKLRSQVRRPEKEGMTVRISDTEGLEDFYNVFSINMRDLGTPVYPKRFFRMILERFPRNTWIATVLHGRTPVASGFLMGFKEKLEIPWASSIRQYNRLGPNMLLYWSSLAFACDRGFRVFDFGRSTEGGSTHRFKEQWGAVPHTLHWHYWLAQEAGMPAINPDNPRYRLAIELWKRLPVPLTRILGPRLVRNIP
jgi:serine/alanine adding enzyme